MEGSRNLSGVADPVVDALIETHRPRRDARRAQRRPAASSTACCAPAHYWVPMWYSDAAWLAYWDAFSRPATQPKLGVGAPDTWWWDEDKAKKIGL